MNQEEQNSEEQIEEQTNDNNLDRQSPPKKNIFKEDNKDELNIEERMANARIQQLISQNQIIEEVNEQINEEINEQAEIEQLQKNKEENNEKLKTSFKNNMIKSVTNMKDIDADENLKKQITKKVLEKLLTKKTLIIGGIVILIIILIILLSTILSNINGDISEINTSPELIGIVTGDLEFKDVASYFVYLGLCPSSPDKEYAIEQCEKSAFGQFLLHFKEIYKKYLEYKDRNGNPIKLDIPLIMETVSYNRSNIAFRTLLEQNNDIWDEVDELAEAMVEKATEYGDLYKCVDTNCSSCSVTKDKEYKTYYHISDNKYVSFLKYGQVHENYSELVKKYDVDIHPESNEQCIPEGRSYKDPIENRYQIEENIINNNPQNPINTNIKTTEIKIPISGLSKTYKVAWVSDLHLISKEDRNNMTANNRYENDFYTSGTHSDEWLQQIVEYLNNGGFDAVIFGGDMVDQGTSDNIKLFKEYFDKINIPNKMYVRADHDYLSNLYGTAGNQSSITGTSDIYSFTLENVTFIGIDYSNKDLSDSGYSDLISKINNSSNAIIVTHVPYESKVSDGLKNLSLSKRNKLYYWQSIDSSDNTYFYSSGNNSNMNNYLNDLYNSDKIRYVLAGHMHTGWNGLISSKGLNEQIFGPAYEGNVGVIYLQPK